MLNIRRHTIFHHLRIMTSATIYEPKEKLQALYQLWNTCAVSNWKKEKYRKRIKKHERRRRGKQRYIVSSSGFHKNRMPSYFSPIHLNISI
jgi:tRNA A37 methylthiotransferase MiaB